ncbi:hypothetical protein, partial [Enterococcus durans]|uniref:hypothetical protein n=1 Tax=Enterococcus durans TaxID=53345 RepID=UPI001D0B5F88
MVQELSSLPATFGNLWMAVFDTVFCSYHQKLAKDRANKEGIVVKSLFGELEIKDWIKENKGYNADVF